MARGTFLWEPDAADGHQDTISITAEDARNDNGALLRTDYTIEVGAMDPQGLTLTEKQARYLVNVLAVCGIRATWSNEA